MKQQRPKDPDSGLARQAFENGRTASEIHFRDHLKHGPYILYHDNGAKMLEGFWNNGKLHGTTTTWFASGAVQSEVSYLHGLRHGRSASYHENGQLKESGLYDLDRPIGLWQQWDERGQLVSEMWKQ